MIFFWLWTLTKQIDQKSTELSDLFHTSNSQLRRLTHTFKQHFSDSYPRIMYLEGWFLSLLLGDIVGDICHFLHTNFITPHQPSTIFIDSPGREMSSREMSFCSEQLHLVIYNTLYRSPRKRNVKSRNVILLWTTPTDKENEIFRRGVGRNTRWGSGPSTDPKSVVLGWELKMADGALPRRECALLLAFKIHEALSL